jgi:hypothetical protein
MPEEACHALSCIVLQVSVEASDRLRRQVEAAREEEALQHQREQERAASQKALMVRGLGCGGVGFGWSLEG